MSSVTSDRAAASNASTPGPGVSRAEALRLRDVTPEHWKSGLAAWLGWLFDGLDMHLYTIVAIPFVAQLSFKRESRRTY